MSNLDIPSKFTNKGTIINGSIGYDGKVTLGIEDNQGTIANNVGNMTELHLPNLKTSTGTIATGCPKLSVLELDELETHRYNTYLAYDCQSIEEIYLPKFVSYWSNGNFGSDNGGYIVRCKALKYISAPNMISYEHRYGSSNFLGFITHSNSLISAIFPSLSIICPLTNSGSACAFIVDANNLRILKLGSLIENTKDIVYSTNSLVHLEIGGNSNCNIRLAYWNPINALDSSSSSLVEDTDICSNNLEQFLYNFREYIVKRLAVKSAKTYIYLHATTKSFILGDYAQSWTVSGESDTYYVSLNNELTNRNWGLA